LQYDLTRILADDNRIEILVLSPAPSPQPPTSFPHDARLAVIGHS
jgi:hypothetical protein